jgi:hypothetical protein
MGVLIGFTIGLALRLVIWAARTTYRFVAKHPVAALLAWLAAASEGWITGRLMVYGLLGLTLWAVLSIVSARFPSRAAPRRPGARRAHTSTRVSYGGGPWQSVEHRDALDGLAPRDRRRFDRAVRRRERQLADAGVGPGPQARHVRRRRRRGVRP